MRIGIDLGGTKIEVIALSNEGQELFRKRTDTPRFDYQQTLQAIASSWFTMQKPPPERPALSE